MCKNWTSYHLTWINGTSITNNISRYSQSHRIISYNVISYDVISYDMMSYDMISYDIITYHIKWYQQIEKNTKDKKVSDSSLIESSNYSFTDSPLNLTSQEPNIPDDNMYILKSKILPPTCPVCPTLEKTKPVSYDVMKEMKYVEKDNFEKNMPMPLLNDFNKF